MYMKVLAKIEVQGCMGVCVCVTVVVPVKVKEIPVDQCV